jgi:hypothetical protein
MDGINIITKMNASSSSLGATSSPSSKPTQAHNKNKSAVEDTIVINEKIDLTKNQYEILNIICKSYDKSISEYMQEALVRSMQSDIEDGNLCDVLLDKLDEVDNDDKEMQQNNDSASSPNTINDDLEMLKKLQTTLP